MTTVYDLNLDQLSDRLVAWDEPAFRAKQVWSQLWKRAATYEQMSDVSPALRKRLAVDLPLGVEVLTERTADRGATRKALLKLGGQHVIEAVLMGDPDRVTVCISSQAGCAMGCTFCATGQMGLQNNLTAGEIAAQAVWARREAAKLPDSTPQRLTNVVFMGMGEAIGGCLLPRSTNTSSGLFDHDRGDCGASSPPRGALGCSAVPSAKGFDRGLSRDLQSEDSGRGLMTVIPGVRYAKSDDFLLAYQVVGEGERDLVYLQFETPTVVGHWLFPENARFLERLASFSRLILTDRRGMGCSDRLPPGVSPTLEDLVEDLLAVMEDAYVRNPVLFAGFETAFVALMAAAAHPDRFDGLILYRPGPSWRRSAELPWERSEDGQQHELGVIRKATDLHAWAEQYARAMIPSRAGDRQVVSSLEALSALSGTPEAWYWDQVMWNEVDVLDLLPSIQIPTLVLLRPDATGYADPRSTRVVAERIPGARLVELPGVDALPWFGESEPVLAEIRGFVTGSRDTPPAARRLATVLFTDIVGSTRRSADLGDTAWRRALEDHREAARQAFARHGGREIGTAGDGFLAAFDGPAAAARCAIEIANEAEAADLPIRAGVHTGEVELIDGEIGGIGVTICARVAAEASASEVLVTSTVKDLTAGSGLAFEDVGEHELKGVPDTWHLYRVLK